MNHSESREAPIELCDYDPAWPDQFAEERDRLVTCLAAWLVGAIEHIGSTAIPGARAKPVIDIMAPVANLTDSRPAIDAVRKLEYVYYPYRPDVMHWFCKPSAEFRTHHLHLVPRDNPLWHARLTFRDHLRAHADILEEYTRLKDALAARYRYDREAYTDGKALFIQGVLDVALRAER